LIKYIIAPALQPLGFDPPVRADGLPTPGVITHQVVELLRDADLVVADLTDGNPNVFYELAARHAFQKPVVHVIQDGGEIPFDLLTTRTVFYDLRDLDKVEATLAEVRAYTESALQQGANQDNPLVAALDAIVLRHSADPFAQTLAAITEELGGFREEHRKLAHNLNILEKLKAWERLAEGSDIVASFQSAV
jgi:hypothetical protein